MVVKKLFFVWHEAQEQAFLEDMAQKGYLLQGVGFGKYTFEKAAPARVVYQFDFRTADALQEHEYLQIYQDDGWHCAARFGGWYYFYKEQKDEAIALSLFSNNASKNAKYKRVVLFLLLTGLPLYLQLFLFFPNIPDADFAFPGFYFFLRLVLSLVLALHTFVVIKIIRKFLLRKDRLKE